MGGARSKGEIAIPVTQGEVGFDVAHVAGEAENVLIPVVVTSSVQRQLLFPLNDN